MNSLFITYTLEEDSNAWQEVNKLLKSYPNWAKLFRHTWIVQTNKSVTQVRDELSEIISKGKILVIDITYSQWATCEVDRKVVEWMKKYA